MNNPSSHFKCLCLWLLGMIVWIPAWGQHHPAVEHKVFEVQQSFARGEIEVDEAVMKQFKMLYEPTKDERIYKCATPVFMFYEANKEQVSSAAKAKINSYQSAARSKSTAQTGGTYISPSGKFEIRYDTTGSDSVSIVDENENGVPDYVEWVAEAADSSYKKEITEIGYSDPINGPSNPYPVFIENTGSGIYGVTERDSNNGTLIRIHNSFKGFPENTSPKGNVIGAINATMAHELKHAIQYIQNSWSGDSNLWGEMDATLMEEVVYDDVNDYYNYINSFSSTLFRNPSTSLIPGSYEDITWALFFEEWQGADFWRTVWAQIEEDPSEKFLDVVRDVVEAQGDNYKKEIVRAYLWHFASGDRAGSDSYGFEEKGFYPNANMEDEFTELPDADTVRSISPMAARYFEIIPESELSGYIDAAVDFDSTQVGLGLLFYMKDGSIEEAITTGEEKEQVYLPTDIMWDDVEKLGLVLANFSRSESSKPLVLTLGSSENKVDIRDPDYVDLPKEIKVHQNYPNPFNPTTNITFEIPRSANVTLEVYDIMGRKIQTLADGTFRVGSHSILFDGSELSSGTYLYRLQIDNMSITKKMMLVK